MWGGIGPLHGKAGAAQLGTIESKHRITACTRAYVQVSDFGLSRAVDASKAASTVLVTNPRWVSHEICSEAYASCLLGWLCCPAATQRDTAGQGSLRCTPCSSVWPASSPLARQRGK